MSKNPLNVRGKKPVLRPFWQTLKIHNSKQRLSYQRYNYGIIVLYVKLSHHYTESIG